MFIFKSKIMLKIRLITISFILCILFGGCKDEINLPDQPLSDYISVYMPQAANGPVTYNFSTSDTLPAIIYGAGYGGLDYPEEDVRVTFNIGGDAIVDSFNTANNSNYALLPAKSYKFESELEGVVKRRELATTPFKLRIVTSGENAPDLSKTYLLPISIEGSSIKVNQKLRTQFCIINIIPAFFNRTDWAITALSSQESNGEGPNNGKATFALDGNINTFWHTQWQGAQPGPPHYLTIDMGITKRVSGAAFVARQGVSSGRPQDIQIFLSDDNSNWQLAYTGSLTNDGATQKVFFEQAMQGRYVKLLINTSFSSNMAHLAEFYLF